MKMNNQTIINLLLAVPFNDDYKIAPEIRKQLTSEEFFENCFLKPAEDDYLKKSLHKYGEQDEIISFDQDILKEDIQKKLNQQEKEMAELEDWIKSRQPDLYCLLGDAGAGKSTLLHYLKYKYEPKNIVFDIIDIQKATEEVKILNRVIKVPEFYSLYAKSAAALIKHISDSLFVCNENDEDVIDTNVSVDVINHVKNRFIESYRNRFPRDEVESFFKLTYCNDVESYVICKQVAEILFNHMKHLLDSLDIKEVFSILLEIYIYILLCKDEIHHHIVAFDNFERFIGVQEIYNKQLTDFVVDLRSIQNNITYNNRHLQYKYQLVICMRHTSVRMFTSKQVTEFMPHRVDINEWFEPSSVIRKKLDWLKEHKIDIEGIKHIPAILQDMGESKNALRGLHFKISMLFNYNKRVIVTFLVNILRPSGLFRDQTKYIEKYDYFWNEDSKLSKNLSRFAARSIVYRMVLDSLRDDGFFQCIMVQEIKPKNSNVETVKRKWAYSRSRLGFARKILTILHNYDSLYHQERGTSYMTLDDLLKELFPAAQNPLAMLFDKNNRNILNNIVQIMFYMNYYSPREQNWLQFIDIQYDIADTSNPLYTISIDDSSELVNLIRENHSNINIRITNAGKAYLYFVVYHFEYFACRNISIQGNDIPPLLYTIPTLEEIEASNPENLTCIKIIKKVQNDALKCINKMSKDNNVIYFIKDGKKRLHSQRIINSHRGYLDNFVQCLRAFYSEELKQGNKYSQKINDIIDVIIRIRNNYK